MAKSTKTLHLPKQKSADQRAYEASSGGRRLVNWDAPNLSPTTAATTELQKLRSRSRASTRNNGWISRALRVGTANEIGTGIVPRPETGNETFDKDLMELHKDYAPLADATGLLGLYGIQKQAVRARRESGEVFIRIIRKRSDRNMPVPLQFQLLEADFCPIHLNRGTTNGNRIISGVEVNRFGKPVAYWFYKNHPDEDVTSLHDMVRVKSEDVIHHFMPDRPGQLRGVPDGTQALVRAYVFDKYDDAELGRKESRSNFTGVIRRPDYGIEDYKFDPMTGEPVSKDDTEVPMIDMETGSFPSLLPGEDITLFDGDDAGRGYKDFQHYQLLAIAAGHDTPYQLLTGDYSNINDRVWRAIMNQYHREIEQDQMVCTIPQLCRRMWIEFVDRAILSGAINVPSDYADNRFKYIRAKHRPQAWKHIHPVQDVQARKMEVEEGFTSRQKVVDGSSDDSVEEIDNQRKIDNDREKILGLTKDDNDEKPNNTSKTTTKPQPK